MDFPSSSEDFGFVGIASATPRVAVGDPRRNAEYIIESLATPELHAADIIVMPELCITGYTCGDLFLQQNLIREALDALVRVAESTCATRALVAVGAPLPFKGRLYNCAVIIAQGSILGAVPKIHIPNYQEFYEKRWFASGQGISRETIDIRGEEIPFGTDLLFRIKGVNVGIEICEDLWVPIPPSSSLCVCGADVILNLSATDDNIGKYGYIRSLVASQSARCRCAYAYASAGRGESSSDLVFSGINLIASDGELLAESERFSRVSNQALAVVDIERLRLERRKYSTFFDNASTFRDINIIQVPGLEPMNDAASPLLPEGSLRIDPRPFIPSDLKHRERNCSEIVEIQSWGLARRLEATGCRHLVVGISGGLDSTLALLVAHHTFAALGIDPKGIIGVTMPAEATSERTHSNARILMESLGVTFLEIPVKKAVEQHFSDIGHDPEIYDAVYENSQARERTQILMDLANKYSGMVLGTGDMSELALGWCTYNGDHMSMYNVNAGVPKTLVRHLVNWFADSTDSPTLRDVLLDIIATPISPELIPSADESIAQKTEELVGPYELHDFFLFHMLRNGFSPRKIFFLASIAFREVYDSATIKKWMIIFYHRFFSHQFKRSCMPDGPKIGSVCLSPRGDWRMPSDASAAIWIAEAESISI